MAPTTRAATKRLHAGTDPADAMNKKIKGEEHAAMAKMQPRCRLLELPAELRNRIYELAVEDFVGEETPNSLCDCGYCHEDPHGPPYRWAPRTRCFTVLGADLWKNRPWQFYGLTQACKQLRAEYRPLWMQALEVRLNLTTLPQFVKTFLPEGPSGDHAPKLIQVSWFRDRHKSSEIRGDLAPLFRIKALFPALRFQFVPLEVADAKVLSGQYFCESCEDMQDANPDFSDFYPGYVDNCECSDEDMPWSEWVMLEELRISYTRIFEDLLANSNSVWLGAVGSQDITVNYSIVDKNYPRVTFRIVCKETFCHGVSDSQGAWDLLDAWGIFELPRKAEMYIVLVYEEVEKVVLNGLEVENSVLREFRVPRGRAVKAGPNTA